MSRKYRSLARGSSCSIRNEYHHRIRIDVIERHHFFLKEETWVVPVAKSASDYMAFHPDLDIEKINVWDDETNVMLDVATRGWSGNWNFVFGWDGRLRYWNSDGNLVRNYNFASWLRSRRI